MPYTSKELALAALEIQNNNTKKMYRNLLNQRGVAAEGVAYGPAIAPKLKKILNNRRKSVNLELEQLRQAGLVSASTSRAGSPVAPNLRRSRRARRRNTRKAATRRRRTNTRRSRK